MEAETRNSKQKMPDELYCIVYRSSFTPNSFLKTLLDPFALFSYNSKAVTVLKYSNRAVNNIFKFIKALQHKC